MIELVRPVLLGTLPNIAHIGLSLQFEMWKPCIIFKTNLCLKNVRYEMAKYKLMLRLLLPANS